ncbi:unnamed protein product, partial [Polarella glacialis]
DRKKDRDRSRSRPAKNASKSRSSESRPKKKEKESKLAEPPDWVPKSPSPEKAKTVKADMKKPSAVFGEMPSSLAIQSPPSHLPASQRAAPPGAGSAPDGSVPDWLADLMPSAGTGPGGLLRPRVPHREVMVPQPCVARLIGKGGEVIMAICNQTGADVKIKQETKEQGYSLAIITGHPDAMDAAERMVRQKLGLSGSTFVSKEMPISAEQVPLLMGPKASSSPVFQGGDLRADSGAVG